MDIVYSKILLSKNCKLNVMNVVIDTFQFYINNCKYLKASWEKAVIDCFASICNPMLILNTIQIINFYRIYLHEKLTQPYLKY